MFHKASTEAERQKLFDDYMLRILKEKEVIKKNKKLLTIKILFLIQLLTRKRSKVLSIVMLIV